MQTRSKKKKKRGGREGNLHTPLSLKEYNDSTTTTTTTTHTHRYSNFEVHRLHIRTELLHDVVGTHHL